MENRYYAHPPPPTHTITCKHPPPPNWHAHVHIEKTPSNWGHTDLFFFFFFLLSKRGLIREMPFQPGTDQYSPTGSLVYILLYAIWVNWGPTRNRGRPRLAVCAQFDGILSCVRPRSDGYYKYKPTHTPTQPTHPTHILILMGGMRMYVRKRVGNIARSLQCQWVQNCGSPPTRL